MSDEAISSGDEPRARLTYGELRRRLEAMGNPWEVDPSISDDTEVPQYPTGGEPVGREEPPTDVAPDDSGTSIRDLIAAIPPNDPDLRSRWAEEGMPLTVPEGASESGRAPLPGEPFSEPSDREAER